MTNSIKKLIKQQSDPNLLLLPKINEYLLHHGDQKYTPEAMEAVWGALTTPPRDRSRSFSSSAAGVDLRHQELAYLGYPQKAVMPDLQLIFTLGHWSHALAQGLLLSAKLIQDIEVPVGNPKYYSKGSMDGEGYVWWEPANPAWANRPFLLEFKSVGQWAWDKKVKLGRPSDDHLAQIHRYMLLSGHRLCSYLMFNKGGGSPSLVEYVVESDDQLLEESLNELEELKKAVETQTLHPQSPACKSSIKNNCPYGGNKGYCGNVHDWVTFDEYQEMV